jgi:hypothetical protein
MPSIPPCDRLRRWGTVKWWDMERFSAQTFFMIGRLLERLKRAANPTKPFALSEAISPNPPIPPPPSQEEIESAAGAIELRQSILQAVSEACKGIGLTISVKQIDDIRTNLTNYSPPEIENCFENLRKTVNWEMEDRLFMFIPPERAKFYDQYQSFGVDVDSKFPDTQFDVYEAGNCYSAGRWTACVFHLMRTLEVGLIAFGNLFPAVSCKKENWQQIIQNIEAEIRKIPQLAVKPLDWKGQLESYSQIANNFMFFKDAWRNYTAHARGKYTEEEAQTIYLNVKVFMQNLSKVV